MTGTVHVNPAGTPYPHDQGFYNRQGRDQGQDLLVAGLQDRAREQAATVASPGRTVITVGAAHADGVVTTPGGEQSYMIARFLPGTRSVRVGETVTWTAEDFATPHTMTFGAPPASPVGPVGLTGPGEQTTLATPFPQVGVGPTVSSGFLGAATVSGSHGTTFRVTFATPGTYQYYCALHRDLGMTGTIIVR
jgi:plastocyanin